MRKGSRINLNISVTLQRDHSSPSYTIMKPEIVSHSNPCVKTVSYGVIQ